MSDGLLIAVTFALPAESSEFVRLLDNRTPVGRGSRIVRGQLRGQKIAILHTGVGRKIARQRMEDFFATERAAYCISAGFAGALDPQLKVGDIILAENFSSSDLLRSPRLDLDPLAVFVGKLVTARSVIEEVTRRESLAKETGAIAVDMETEVIAASCAARNIPMLSIRAISDTEAAPFPAPAAVLFDLEKQETNVARLAFHLATHPRRISHLLQFHKQIAAARKSLTAALDAVLRSDLR